MPLVDAKCTNCGAPLKVDKTKEAAICEYCGSAFIVEKAINNYSITNQNTIHAQVVNIYENKHEIERISLFESYKRLLEKNDLNNAELLIKQLFLKYPDEEIINEYKEFKEKRSRFRIAAAKRRRLVEEKRRNKAIEEEEKRRKMKYRNQGKCQYCGSDFKGLFSKVCSNPNCGKPKDY